MNAISLENLVPGFLKLIGAGSSSDRGMATLEQLRARHIDLLIRIVANTIYEDPPLPAYLAQPEAAWLAEQLPDLRGQGVDWPSVAHSMMGVARL